MGSRKMELANRSSIFWNRKEVREAEKIDQTIEAICGYIQVLMHVGRAGYAAELTNALAALITARANLNMSLRIHEGKKTIQNHQM